jgi:hypothetical protein
MATVDNITVAKYYIECELGNIVDQDTVSLLANHYTSNPLRLLEALSFTYRLNSVFDYIANDRYRWEVREVAIDDIVLTGMGEVLTKVIYSEAIAQNVRKFIQYIAAHEGDSTFDELRRSSPVPKQKRTVILRQEDGILKMLDGSHRLISMAMAGAQHVNAYVAVIDNDTSLPKVGDAVFLRLRKVWTMTNDASVRSSVEGTVIGMIKMTEDGRRAVKSYWVDMAPSEEVRDAGARILESSS